MTRRHLVLVGLALALGVPAGLVAQKEYVLAHGEQVFLMLEPVDPRSLLEGDYMRLSYGISNEVRRARLEVPGDGQLVLRLDERRVAHFARLDDGSPLSMGELRLRYRWRHGFVRLGSDAYYFQEGEAGRYAAAKYGEVRLTTSGDAVLVGLRDASLQALKGRQGAGAPREPEAPLDRSGHE